MAGLEIHAGEPLTPVEVTMKVNGKYRFSLRKDSKTLLSTAGVLGETYINIDSSTAAGPEVSNNDVLKSSEQSGYQDVMRSTQNALQNMQALLEARSAKPEDARHMLVDELMPQLIRLRKLADALKVTLDSLVPDEPSEEDTPRPRAKKRNAP